MKKMKKVLCFTVAMVITVSSLMACSSQKSGTAEKSTPNPTMEAETKEGTDAVKEETQEIVEVDWYVDLPWWSWNGNGFGDDLTSQIILEKTGVKINFIVPASDGGEQLSSMIASDELPDILTVEGWWSSRARMLTYQMASEDYLWAFNDLMDQYAPELKDVMRQDVFDWYAEADGKTYLVPNYAYSKDDLVAGEQLVPNGAITIRQDLYEAIGSPDMSTPEGFLAACEKIKNEVKTYNGQEIIPIQLYEGVGNSILWLAQYFATPYEDENGNYVYDFTHENYKEALQFLNTAYQKGLVSDANFSDSRELVNEKIASGRVFAMITAPQDFVPQLQALYDLDSNAVYKTAVLRNSKGEDPVLQDIRGFGWLTTGISKDTKNPEQIAKLFAFLLSDEGQIAMCYGKEGVTFNYNPDGTVSFTEEYEAAMKNNDTKKYALSAMNLLDNYAFRRKFEVMTTDPKQLATVDTIMKLPLAQYSYDYSAAGLKLDPTDSRKEAMNELGVKVSTYRTTVIAQLVTAADTATFNKLYDDAVAELNAMGISDLIAYNNDGFQAAKKALGIERSWAPFTK
ncbi:MAG: extracellular solute-binding protein family 1 [Herbinix sp.]|jgi:putative aldouronate transport system substrate-binding protein|nr:extracellular solute-binding protein family 1 [Herbinix sp.]